MPRNPTDIQIEQFTDASTENKALAEIRAENNQVAAADQVIMGSFDVIKALGRIEAANFFTTVGDKLIAETAINIREGKQYKGLPYKDENGNLRHVGDFPEFCKAFLGKSYTRTMELISNYNILGAHLYEQAERLGFRQRDYNALKALPAEDRQIIAQAIEEESLDKALDLMQQMAAKHYRAKEADEKLITKLVDQLEAKDGVIKEKTEELNKKSERINLLEAAKRKTVDEADMPGEYQLMRLQEYTREITVKIAATLNKEIVLLFKEFPDAIPPQHIELAARQSIGLIISAAYGVADNMGIDPILEASQADDLPAKADAEAFLEWQAKQQAGG